MTTTALRQPSKSGRDTVKLLLAGPCGVLGMWGGLISTLRIHDVSKILRAEAERLPEVVRPEIDRLADMSHSLRRERELAFYGSEDITPSDSCEEKDGRSAFEQAEWVVGVVRSVLDCARPPPP